MSRETVHRLVRTRGGNHFLVSSLATRSDTQIISIDPHTGQLGYTAQPGVDLFPTETEALAVLSDPVVQYQCCAVVGFVVIGQEACLLAAKAKPTMLIPPAHRCYTITSCRWIRIPLLFPFNPLTKEEKANLANLLDFKLDNLHVYCETYDLTHRFPNALAITDYDAEFVWNHQLRSPFQRVGLDRWCCVVLQGMAEDMPIDDAGTCRLGLITKRSCLNVGARFFSRGLNESNGAGNEYECELIMCAPSSPATLPALASDLQALLPVGAVPATGVAEVRWSSLYWLRGTVPVNWKSDLSMADIEADIVISPDPYKGVTEYWRRVRQRYDPCSSILCVSLLRRAAHQEVRLGDTYEQSLAETKKALNLDMDIVHFDWHAMHKQSLDATVKGLWAAVGNTLKAHGVNAGRISWDPRTLQVLRREEISKQRGVIRWNCLDSLDRTNVSNWVASLQVVGELGRMAGASLFTPSDGEMAPNPLTPWPCLGHLWEDVKRWYSKELLSCLSALFVSNGDLCSTLYTNSEAMLSQTMRAFCSQLPGATRNAVIAIKRRYQNVVEDKKRTAQYEMLIGRGSLYFPSCFTPTESPARVSGDSRTRCLTAYPACVTKHPPSSFNYQVPPERILLDSSPLAWFVPKDVEYAETSIALPQHCQPTEICVTIRHGVVDHTSPVSMDVFVGDYEDTCFVAWQNLRLPICEDGTRLFYYFPSHISGCRTTEREAMYDFRGPSIGKWVKSVHVNFHGTREMPMTLGPVQIYGFVHEPSRTPTPPEALATHTGSMVQTVVGILKSFGDALDPIDLSAPRLRRQSPPPAEGDSDGMTVNGAPPQPGIVAAALSQPLPLSPDLQQSGAAGSGVAGNRQWGSPVDPADYLKHLKARAKGERPNLTFNDTLDLEVCRLRSGLSALQRDSILTQLGLPIATFDPNRKIVQREEAVELSLARRLQTPQCYSCVRPLKLRRKELCSYCRMTYCKNCMHTQKLSVPEYGWDQPNYRVCQNCARSIEQQQRTIVELRRLSQEDARAHEAWRTQRRVGPRDVGRPLLSHIDCEHPAQYPQLLADAATGSVLFSVPTAAGSPPIEAIFPSDTVQHLKPTQYLDHELLAGSGSYWFAPEGVKTVDITILLAARCYLDTLAILVDSLGYSATDAPTITARAGPTTSDLVDVGCFDLLSLLAEGVISCDSFLPLKPETTSQPVRVLSLHFALPETDAAVFLHIGRVFVLGKVAPTPLELVGTVPTSVSPTAATAPPAVEVRPGGLSPRLSRQMPDALSPEEWRAFEGLWSSGTPLQRKTLPKKEDRFLIEKGTLDLLMTPTTVAGFRLDKRFNTEDPNAQLKTMRVMVLRGEEGEVISQIFAGEYIVPKVLQFTSLFYPFDEVYTNVICVRFIFLANYGSSGTSTNSISLFAPPGPMASSHYAARGSTSQSLVQAQRQYCLNACRTLELLHGPVTTTLATRGRMATLGAIVSPVDANEPNVR
eukprot:TRINITY_DN7345_c0_g1_i1.p1 TRINITY_DN7345_c0_g1~~TRINITY_DN7345_c0_g1_i1.p1  ORF type:complete len:1470 (+),score=203.16 TRINITY_DN7345_c0_g1_i1:66-4475(+)